MLKLNNPPIDLIQKRIANISVGASTVRNQPERTVDKARKYLQQKINLKDFSCVINEDEFRNLLDKHTKKLKDELHNSWGIARKVLNIFLFQAVHDIILNRNYALNKIITYLEVPLDNRNAKELKKFAKREGVKLEWKNISSLKSETSMQFQEYAKQYANLKNCERCYLDVYWWRSE